jgi:hydrogenase 3 maturation protease
MGNALLGDDAVGCRVAELLRERGMRGVVDCGTTPENHTSTLRKNPPRALLIVDAADMGLSPGECRKLSLGQLDSAMESSHGLPLSILLADFADSMEITALGIQPSVLQLGAPLSEPVEKAAHRVADLIAQGRWDGLESFGNSATSLNEVYTWISPE